MIFAMERTQHYPRHFRPSYQGYQGLQAYFHMIPDSNLPEASIGLHHISKNVEREECNNKMMLDTYRVRWNILVQYSVENCIFREINVQSNLLEIELISRKLPEIIVVLEFDCDLQTLR